MKRKSLGFLAVLVLSGIFLWSLSASAKDFHRTLPYHPMIFVHGYSGSASQFEWQAMRFASNGYPQDYLNAFEYDSPTYSTDADYRNQVYEELDQRIDAILKETGTDQVDLLGHSMGTSLSQAYLSVPAHASKVAHYVNLDGAPAAALPGGVPTLAIWGGLGMRPDGKIEGAQNEVVDGQPHNETCTSPETFALMYKFFTGHDPITTDVLPERGRRINLAGRAVLYPANVGAQGTTLEIYELYSETGARKFGRPQAVYEIDETGNWGPFKAKAGVNYEFNLDWGDTNHHFYFEPRIRSDYFIRLNTAIPGKGVGDLMPEKSDGSSLIITRNREFLGDQTDGNIDVLAVNGINVVNATTSPVSKFVVAYFVCDWGPGDLWYMPDGKTDLSYVSPLAYPFGSFFLNAIDLNLRGAAPPDATISIVGIPRGDCGAMHEVNVPNWANPADTISVVLDDYIPTRCGERWPARHGAGGGWWN